MEKKGKELWGLPIGGCKSPIQSQGLINTVPQTLKVHTMKAEQGGIKKTTRKNEKRRGGGNKSQTVEWRKGRGRIVF